MTVTATGFGFAVLLAWLAFEVGIRVRWWGAAVILTLLSLEALLWALRVVGY